MLGDSRLCELLLVSFSISTRLISMFLSSRNAHLDHSLKIVRPRSFGDSSPVRRMSRRGCGRRGKPPRHRTTSGTVLVNDLHCESSPDLLHSWFCPRTSVEALPLGQSSKTTTRPLSSPPFLLQPSGIPLDWPLDLFPLNTPIYTLIFVLPLGPPPLEHQIFSKAITLLATLRHTAKHSPIYRWRQPLHLRTHITSIIPSHISSLTVRTLVRPEVPRSRTQSEPEVVPSASMTWCWH